MNIICFRGVPKEYLTILKCHFEYSYIVCSCIWTNFNSVSVVTSIVLRLQVYYRNCYIILILHSVKNEASKLKILADVLYDTGIFKQKNSISEVFLKISMRVGEIPTLHFYKYTQKNRTAQYVYYVKACSLFLDTPTCKKKISLTPSKNCDIFILYKLVLYRFLYLYT